MDKIVTNLSSTTQWQTLVVEASRARKVELPEDIESYLVFLLMRFTASPQIAQKVLGLDFLESMNQVGSLKSLALRDVGDQCLLYSGLFPERARRKRVRVSYFVNIGQSAYQTLSDHDRATDNSLFASLAQRFIPLMDIMHTMRELDTNIPALDPMLAQEVWNDTGSEHALQTLKQFTVSNSIISDTKISPNKH